MSIIEFPASTHSPKDSDYKNSWNIEAVFESLLYHFTIFDFKVNTYLLIEIVSNFIEILKIA